MEIPIPIHQFSPIHQPQSPIHSALWNETKRRNEKNPKMYEKEGIVVGPSESGRRGPWYSPMARTTGYFVGKSDGNHFKFPSQVKAMAHPSLRIGPDQSSADLAYQSSNHLAMRTPHLIPAHLAQSAPAPAFGSGRSTPSVQPAYHSDRPLEPRQQHLSLIHI